MRQFHLAGHAHNGSHIIDTHDHPIVDDVWSLYAKPSSCSGNVPTMIERDDNIPPYDELPGRARHSARHRPRDDAARPRDSECRIVTVANSGSLGDLQRAFQDYLLVRSDGFAAAVRDTDKADRFTLLAVYRNAYSLRLIEVLTNDYPGLLAMAGPADFDHMARAYIAAHPSHHPSVRWFGAGLRGFLGRTAPSATRPTPSRWRASNGRWARRSTPPTPSP